MTYPAQDVEQVELLSVSAKFSIYNQIFICQRLEGSWVLDMAEIFGAVAGALSVAALFDNCVDYFGYVKLGHHLGQDYERCRLKIAIAQTRLSRWGQAVAINENPDFTMLSPTDPLVQQTRIVLEEIGLLFQAVQKTSRRYELCASGGDLTVLQDESMRPVARQLHGVLGKAVAQRQKQTSLVKKAVWALYDGKQFEKLITEFTGFVDDLEKIYPAEQTRRQMVQLEIQEVEDESTLAIAQDAAAEVDNILSDAAKRKSDGIAARNHAGTIVTQDEARVRVGNEFGKDYPDHANITDSSSNTANTVDSGHHSRVHIGSSFGGRSIFDD